MNAWLPQASYPCSNFSGTPCVELRRSKGSIGHAFTVCFRTENQDQASFCPFALREVSVLAELALGHMRYHLTDVPPQSNSPPDAVFGAGRGRPSRPLSTRNRTNRVERPSPDSPKIISKETMSVVVFHWRCEHLPPILHP